MTFTTKQVTELSAPLNQFHIKTRRNFGKGGGSLSYIEGWHAIAEANRIFGFDAWNRETELTPLGEPELGKDKSGDDQWRVRFMAKSTITVGEIVRQGVGYGSGYAKDVGDAYEGAIKEAETDAMKRALMTFGNPFGLALYDKDKVNVGTSDQISAYQARKDEQYPTMEADIRACQSEDELEAWLADNKDAIAKFPDQWKTCLRDEVKAKKEELREAKEAAENNIDPAAFVDDIEGQMNSSTSKEILDEVLDQFDLVAKQVDFTLNEGAAISKCYENNRKRLEKSEAA